MKIDFTALIFEESDRTRHRRRVRLNRKYHARDRWKPRGILHIRQFPHTAWRHDPCEKDVQFNRRKTAPDTGYGVAYERRDDVP